MRRLIAVGTLLLLAVAALVVAQLVLPGIAARQLRDRLSHSGHVISVSVHAFPAVELLWHHADSVDVHMSTYRSNATALGSTLDQSGDAGSLTATVDQLNAGLLTLRHATLRKRGQILTGSADVTEADLRTALPILQSVTPVASGQGQLVFRGTATLFGVTASVDATVSAQNGDVIVTPNLPFGGLAAIRVFSNPHVAVDTVAASPTPSGFAVSATGLLH